MHLRHFLGAVALLAIAGAAASVTSTPPASNVLSVGVKTPVTTSSSHFSSTSTTEAIDHLDFLPPQTTTTQPEATTTVSVAEHEVAGEPGTTTTLPQTTTSTTAAVGGFNAGFESAFVSSINSLRAGQGLTALTRNAGLDAEARSWSESMASSGVLGHSDIGRLIPPWVGVAENVGNGSTVSSVFTALSASSGHLTNMTGDYTDLGVGVWVDGAGILWTTHLFTK